MKQVNLMFIKHACVTMLHCDAWLRFARKPLTESRGLWFTLHHEKYNGGSVMIFCRLKKSWQFPKLFNNVRIWQTLRTHDTAGKLTLRKRDMRDRKAGHTERGAQTNKHRCSTLGWRHVITWGGKLGRTRWGWWVIRKRGTGNKGRKKKSSTRHTGKTEGT